MTVELREDRTELEAQFRLHLELEDAHGEALALGLCVLLPEVVKSGLETEGTLLELALLLIAHGHIVE